jgi:hypothetical protein
MLNVLPPVELLSTHAVPLLQVYVTLPAGFTRSALTILKLETATAVPTAIAPTTANRFSRNRV